MNVAIIPARGGSKRIPRKNINHFCGKPIIAYSIEAAFQSGCFDKVFVSTDDLEIATIAKKYGALVPNLRSSENSDDFSTIADVMIEVVETLKDDNVFPDNICCIFATAPFVTGDAIATAYTKLLEESFTAIFPVVEYSYPIQRSLGFNNDGTISMVWPEHLLSRSQDLVKRYHDAGQFYWIKTKVMLEEGTLFVKNASSIVINSICAQDIDTPNDWLIAELKYKALNNVINSN